MWYHIRRLYKFEKLGLGNVEVVPGEDITKC